MLQSLLNVELRLLKIHSDAIGLLNKPIIIVNIWVFLLFELLVQVMQLRGACVLHVIFALLEQLPVLLLRLCYCILCLPYLVQLLLDSISLLLQISLHTLIVNDQYYYAVVLHLTVVYLQALVDQSIVLLQEVTSVFVELLEVSELLG
jgi:hypothetical protein